MRYLLFLIVFNCTVPIFGQSRFISEPMSEGVKSGIGVTLPGVDTKFVDNQWKSYIRKYGGKYKWNRKGSEHLNEGSTLPGVSDKPINIYARSQPSGNDVQFFVWIKEGDKFISSVQDTAMMQGAMQVLNHFTLEVAREKLKEDIKEEEKQLSRMESEQKKMERAKEKLEKDIEDYKNKIAKAEQDIIQSIQDQANNRASMERQQEKIDALKSKLKEL
jgi:hypothetical protein